MLRTIILFCLLVLAIGYADATAQPAREIRVIGTAGVVVRPDRAAWRVSIYSHSGKIAEAKKLNDEKLNKLLEAAQRLGVPESDLEIGNVRVELVFDDNNAGTRKFKHYSLYRTVILRQQHMDRFDDYFNGVVLDAESQAHVEYEVSNAAAIADSLRLAAVSDAKLKAEAMAAVLGATVGRAILISEYRPSDPEFRMDTVVSRLSASGGTNYRIRLPEAMALQSEVYVTFELQ